jgi:hypothetical protein
VVPMTLEKTVEELTRKLDALTAKQEIADLITWRFARAIDWLDEEAAKACFHEDGRFAYDAVDMNAHEFCKVFTQSAADLKMRWHFIGSPAVAVRGERASGEAYAIYAANYVDKTTGKLRDYVVAARYLSELERRNGVWRMTQLKVLFDWSFGQDTPEKTASGNTFTRDLDIRSPLYRRI